MDLAMLSIVKGSSGENTDDGGSGMIVRTTQQVGNDDFIIDKTYDEICAYVAAGNYDVVLIAENGKYYLPLTGVMPGNVHGIGKLSFCACISSNSLYEMYTIGETSSQYDGTIVKRSQKYLS